MPLSQPPARGVVVESKKTLSRRAASRQSSTFGGSSRAASATNSKVNSRQPSDDEADDLISEGGWSTTDSIDGVLGGAEKDSSFSYADELDNRIEAILDRKRSSTSSREQDFAAYTYLLRSQYSQAQIEGKTSDLLTVFLRSVRDEMSEKEAINALKAIQVTILTDATEAPYDACLSPLKTVIASSINRNIKEEALYTLGVAAFFGGAAENELEDILSGYLLEIVESDGAHVSAPDDPDVVSAAIDVLALLSTRIQDISETSQDIITALVDQLDSSDARVQVAAGEAIALLYEKSYSELEDGEQRNEDDGSVSSTNPTVVVTDASGDRTILKKRYDPYRSPATLIEKLTELSKVSAKSLSKADRKLLRTGFADVLQSVEQPHLGPRYSSAIVAGTEDQHYGSRMKIKFGKNGGTIVVSKWWMLVRLQAIRRVMQGGMVIAFEQNAAVQGALKDENWDG